MPLSSYIKTYHFNKGHLLVFSTKRGSISILSEDIIRRAESGLLGPAEADTLKRLGIVCEDRDAEKTEVSSLINRLNSKKTGITATVVLNLDCNFDCVYCYEGSLKGSRYMTEETADLVVSFVKSRFVPGMKHITFDFYGGEPLLSRPVISRISSEMKEFASRHGAAFSFTLVTNGSLFMRRTAAELAGLGLSSIKTTLDGPPRLHDRCRPFKGGGGSFSAIVRNLKETWDLCKVGVSGNFQKDNYRDFPELLDLLLSEGLTPERIYQVKFDPVMKRQEGFGSVGDFVEGCMSISEPWLIEASVYLRDEILRRGFSTPGIAPSPCQVELEDAYVVHYDGSLYKCPACIGMGNLSAGDLRTGLRDYKEACRIPLWRTEECLNCEYLPLCFGGCRYLSIMRTGVIAPDCKKSYLDATLESFIRQDVKYRQRSGGRG